MGAILAKMYNEAKKGEKVAMIHLFGIKYGNTIKENISETYVTELTNGANLSKHVKER